MKATYASPVRAVFPKREGHTLLGVSVNLVWTSQGADDPGHDKVGIVAWIIAEPMDRLTYSTWHICVNGKWYHATITQLNGDGNNGTQWTILGPTPYPYKAEPDDLTEAVARFIREEQHEEV